MSNLNQWILGVIFVCTVALTALVTHQLTIRQFNQVASAGPTQSNKRLVQSEEQQSMRAPLPQVVVVDGPDELDLLDENQWDRNLQRIRESRKPKGQESRDQNLDSTTDRPKGPADLSDEDDSSTNESESAKILEALSDEEKNELWWRIAAVAHRSGTVAYRYSITAEHARPFALEYKVSIRDIFNFFKSGVKAEWRDRSFENRDAPVIIMPLGDIPDEQTP